MTNREALNKLSRRFPAPPEIDKILADLRDKDDLHTAIIAVSIVEASLEKLIISRLHKGGNTLIGELFKGRGPLSDFNSKILIAHAFGIITEPLADEMHSMRVIRNAFAHAKVVISFDDVPVKKEVDALKMLVAIRSITEGPGVEKGITLELNNKNWFLLGIRMALVMIDTIAGLKGPAERIIEDALRESLTIEPKEGT